MSKSSRDTEYYEQQSKHLQMQFYSTINFHCILNEIPGAASSDSVPNDIGQPANQPMAVDDPMQPIYYFDPNELEHMDDIQGQSNIRVRRPSRS